MPKTPKIFAAGTAWTNASQFVVGFAGGTAIGVALDVALKHLRIAHVLSLSFSKA